MSRSARLACHARSLAVSVAVLGGCAELEPEQTLEATRLPLDGALGDVEQVRVTRRSASAAAVNTVTIEGRLFYNDRREDGLFSVRDDPTGSSGERCNPSGLRDDGSACSLNWLAARYAVIDVIERDTAGGAGCVTEDILATATVDVHGDFSATFTPTEACAAELASDAAIVLRARLRFCGSDYCFAVRTDAGDLYQLVHPGASSSNPLLVAPGDHVVMSDLRFNPGGSDPAVANDYSIAANYYASLVDTVLTLHRDNAIPFYKPEFGEVNVLYPSTQTGSATALSPTEIALIARTDWIKGGVVAHEYGHVVMQRAWDGGYGWDGVGNGGVSWNVSSATEPRIAFKEGFANFIERAVFTETSAYDDPAFDDNATKPLPGPLGEGWKWVTNINKLLSN